MNSENWAVKTSGGEEFGHITKLIIDVRIIPDAETPATRSSDESAAVRSPNQRLNLELVANADLIVRPIPAFVESPEKYGPARTPERQSQIRRAPGDATYVVGHVGIQSGPDPKDADDVPDLDT